MEENPESRRRAPYWVRSLTDQALHGLALKTQRSFEVGWISDRQEWMLEACISELEYRARRDARAGIKACVCQMCCGPFDDGPI